ncbi:hypothetical protein MTP99_004962 [Tenebrio molitor]|nr:hypothetical protein MTP99_004962 [Tenebrio molitor]
MKTAGSTDRAHLPGKACMSLSQGLRAPVQPLTGTVHRDHSWHTGFSAFPTLECSLSASYNGPHSMPRILITFPLFHLCNLSGRAFRETCFPARGNGNNEVPISPTAF